MNCKSLFALGLCLCIVLLSRLAEGQLNFSTGWGKRSGHQLQADNAYNYSSSDSISDRARQANLNFLLQRYYRHLRNKIDAQQLDYSLS